MGMAIRTLLQRDEEIDGEERDGEGGKPETMYACMYEWMDIYG